MWCHAVYCHQQDDKNTQVATSLGCRINKYKIWQRTQRLITSIQACSCTEPEWLSLTVEGTRRLSEMEETERHVRLETELTLLLSDKPSRVTEAQLEPAGGKQHFLCLCISLFAFPFSATSGEDFLRAPAPDCLAWRRGRTMRRKKESTLQCRVGQRGKIKGIKNTHTHAHTHTHTHTRPYYANRGEDTGVHEDTHPGQTSKHAARPQITVITSSTTRKRGRTEATKKNDIKPRPAKCLLPSFRQRQTAPNLT